MDDLYKRYSDPMGLLDNVIESNHSLLAFINKMYELKIDDQLFSIWSRGLTGKSYADFKAEALRDTKPIDKTKVTKSIKNSYNILNNFNPQK